MKATLRTRLVTSQQLKERFLGKETHHNEMDQDVQCRGRTVRTDGVRGCRNVRSWRLQELRLC